MRSVSLAVIAAFFTMGCFAQAGQQEIAPVTIEGHEWAPARQVLPKKGPATVPAAKAITPDDLIVARKAREAQPRNSLPDPSEITPDGRRAQIDKIEDQANSREDDVKGYSYRVTVKNNTRVAANVIYWEYRFVERTDPSNVVRRQFLCSTNLKPGEKRELAAFSGLGPSGVVSAETLTKAAKDSFDEAVFIDRVEFADDKVIQRRDWNFADVKNAVERVTSTRWAPNEVCRPL